MAKNRFFKTTLGVDAEVLVSKAVEYTDDSTMKNFVANAVEGEVAVVKFSDNTIYSTAAAVGDKVYIALKRDSKVEKSAPFVIQAGIMQKLAYVAPVKQISTIVTSPGIAQLVDGGSDITYTSRVAGSAGNDITITYVDPAGNNASLSVTVSGTAITVNLATDGSSNPTSTATLIAAAVNAHATASTLVDATVTGTGSDVAAAMSATNLAGGDDAGFAPAKGKVLEVVIVETTPGLEPLPRWEYAVEMRQGESFNDAVVRLVAKINSTTTPENQGKTRIVTAAVVSNDNITLTAIDYGVHFTVSARGDWADFTTASTTTPFVEGRGTYTQVKEAERQGDIRKGIGHEYPEQNATAAEFGMPTSFADAVGTSGQFVTYQFTYVQDTKTVRNDREFRKNYLFVFLADDTNDAIAEFDTIFANAD